MFRCPEGAFPLRNNPVPLQLGAICCLFVFLCWSCPDKAAASPWAAKEGYGAKTAGKFVFGLKHTIFSWLNPWTEAHDPVYETPWTGYCAGWGKAFVYTAAGAIQLVTFPIPVDFPNVGIGMHIPANHQGVVVKGQQKASEQSVPEAGSPKPSLEAGSSPVSEVVKEKPLAPSKLVVAEESKKAEEPTVPALKKESPTTSPVKKISPVIK